MTLLEELREEYFYEENYDRIWYKTRSDRICTLVNEMDSIRKYSPQIAIIFETPTRYVCKYHERKFPIKMGE